jgi:DNA-binding transcriptional LysR family regulator
LIEDSANDPTVGAQKTRKLIETDNVSFVVGDLISGVALAMAQRSPGYEVVLLSYYDPGRELEVLLNAKLISPGSRPRIERHDVSRGVIKSLISMGLGISLVLESDIGANFSGLAYREFHDGTGPSRIGFSATWRADNENPALENFLKLIAERYPLLSGL